MADVPNNDALNRACQIGGWFCALLHFAVAVLCWFVYFYVGLMALLLWYKTQVFKYSPDSIAEEVSILVCFAVLLRSRVALADRGCGTKRAAPLISVLWLGLPTAFLFGFHLSYQVFVLHADELLASLGLGLLGLEAFLFGLYGSIVANDATERLLLLAGAFVCVAAAATMGGLHESLSGMTAFPGHSKPWWQRQGTLPATLRPPACQPWRFSLFGRRLRSANPDTRWPDRATGRSISKP